MKRALSLCLALAFLTAPARAQQDTMPIPESEYYPLKKGTTWTYKAAGGMNIAIRVVEHEKVGDLTAAKLETTLNGMPVATEHITIIKDGKKDGVYRVKVADKEVKPPLRFLALPPKKGEKWDVNSTIAGETVKGSFVVGEEEVTVPVEKDKKLKAFTVTSQNMTANGQKIELKYYFVANYGVVKQTAQLGGVKVDLELVKFEPGKD